jgi:hypothetical protein
MIFVTILAIVETKLLQTRWFVTGALQKVPFIGGSA